MKYVLIKQFDKNETKGFKMGSIVYEDEKYIDCIFWDKENNKTTIFRKIRFSKRTLEEFRPSYNFKHKIMETWEIEILAKAFKYERGKNENML